jgi:hypothetical protein
MTAEYGRPQEREEEEHDAEGDDRAQRDRRDSGESEIEVRLRDPLENRRLRDGELDGGGDRADGEGRHEGRNPHERDRDAVREPGSRARRHRDRHREPDRPALERHGRNPGGRRQTDDEPDRQVELTDDEDGRDPDRQDAEYGRVVQDRPCVLPGQKRIRPGHREEGERGHERQHETPALSDVAQPEPARLDRRAEGLGGLAFARCHACYRPASSRAVISPSRTTVPTSL